jgi:hypothetical protein
MDLPGLSLSALGSVYRIERPLDGGRLVVLGFRRTGDLVTKRAL